MADTFLISHCTETGNYQVWEWNPAEPDNALVRVAETEVDATLGGGYRVTWVGGYILAWKPPAKLESGEGYVDFALFEFDPYGPRPVGNIVQMGNWQFTKFSDYYAYKNDPSGPAVTDLVLTGCTGYVLSQIPVAGRRGYTLWNFDAYPDQPGAAQDPIENAMGDSDAFPNVGQGDKLLPFKNVVLVVNQAANTWRLFSFDPQAENPLSGPELRHGNLPYTPPFDPGLEFVVVGDHILAWTPGKKEHTIFDFELDNPFSNPRKGKLPDEFPTASSIALAAAHPRLPIDEERAKVAGTLDFMRSNIEHIVYYVLESRSFDSVVGWLYSGENPPAINWIPAGHDYSFEGASTSNSNTDAGTPYYQHEFQGGNTGPTTTLNEPTDDPYHGTPDSILQQWSDGYTAYQAGQTADMGGFVSDNGISSIMGTYNTSQLSVLNTLASEFAVSDMWFCSEAGGTTTNRATMATGSAFNITASYEGGNAYTYFPKASHRQSMWKVLANHGITDWAIYYSVLWEHFPYTYHLFLEGQLPSVDRYSGQYVQPIQSFFDDVANQTLPKFSFLEPVWFVPGEPFTSYHPTGNVLAGEAGLKKIYDAISQSPHYWNKTALVISFSKGGGNYDHVPAKPMKKAWPHDGINGYEFNTTGTRVPTIVISPWVQKNTVFRSGMNELPFDATSLPATVLSWFGIRRSRWGMGDRIAQAPTFESVFSLATARTDIPTVARAGDSVYPVGTPIPIEAPTPVDGTWVATGSSGNWTDLSSWQTGGVAAKAFPTKTATFGSVSGGATEVTFGFAAPQTVQEVKFTADAPSYKILFQEEQPVSPNLTLTNQGVVNESATQTHTFSIEATSTNDSQIQLLFQNTANAGPNTITYDVKPTTPELQSGGIIAFHQRSSAGSANFNVYVGKRTPPNDETVGGEVRFLHHSTAGSGTFTLYGTTGTDGYTFGNVVFQNFATAGTANFTSVGGTVAKGDGGNTQFYSQSSADHGTFTNKGATIAEGNGGDVAFDGTATADHATITNECSPTAGGNGGVTSFNNNSPYMSPFAGARAGQATIHNKGASTSDLGGGGHTKFPGIYGASTADHATIHNYGSENTSNLTGSGFTEFAVNGHWPYCVPTAGNAKITNHASSVQGGSGGNTSFQYQNYDDPTGKADYVGPTAGYATINNNGASHGSAGGGTTTFANTATAGNATIYNHGGSTLYADGGSTTFSGNATAGDSTIYAYAGTNAGDAGRIYFTDYAKGGNANLHIEGGKLETANSKEYYLYLETLKLTEAHVFCKAGQAILKVLDTLTLPDSGVACTFTYKDAADGTYSLLEAPGLTDDKKHLFKGEPAGHYAEYWVDNSGTDSAVLKVKFTTKS